MKAKQMIKLVSTAAAVLLIAGLSSGSASAKQKRHGMQGTTKTTQGMTTGRSVTGGNAAMSGNNGNSASGSNAIQNIKGGDSGSAR